MDRRIRWHYTTTILRLRIGARLMRYWNCQFHNFARTISRHADGISRYSVPPSAGPLLPLNQKYVWIILLKVTFFGFLKVKWLHLTGELDKSVRFSCQIFSEFNIPKSVNFWQSYSNNEKVDVLGTRCTVYSNAAVHNEVSQVNSLNSSWLNSFYELWTILYTNRICWQR